MSFDHRFGVGIGGSYEDPYTPPCCEECPESTYTKCPRTPGLVKKCMMLHHSSGVTQT